MVDVLVTIDSAKDMAKRLRKFLEAGGFEIQHTHACEAVAQMLGYRNWNTLHGVLGLADCSQASSTETAKGLGPAPATDLRFWPWVDFAFRRGCHPDGTPVHNPLTHARMEKDGRYFLMIDLPTLREEPAPFALPANPKPPSPDGEALLGVAIMGIAGMIESYADKDMEGLPESGRDMSRNWSWATSQFPFKIDGTYQWMSYSIRTVGGDTYEERKANLVAEACRAVSDLRAWAAPLVDKFKQTGRSTKELEVYGDWVWGALRSAGLEHTPLPESERRKSAKASVE